ncbi:hypothetical protein [[Eubacterium] cellulosolvens]
MKIYSVRPSSSYEKLQIAQTFSKRLRSIAPFPIKICLVGSVASQRDSLYSDVDIRIVHFNRANDTDGFKYVVQNLATQMFHETNGVWIDAKVRSTVPMSFPGKPVVSI